MNERRGQIGMMETVVILVIFFFLLMTGLLFYRSSASRADASRTKGSLELRALRTAQLASTMPELQCSLENVIQENCIDRLKASAMAEMITHNQQARLFYYDTFLTSRITVQEIYPTAANFTVYERLPAEGATQTEAIYMPIIVYDPTAQGGVCLSLNGGCTFGVLIVEAFR